MVMVVGVVDGGRSFERHDVRLAGVLSGGFVFIYVFLPLREIPRSQRTRGLTKREVPVAMETGL
jgi:hypothetical protein